MSLYTGNRKILEMTELSSEAQSSLSYRIQPSRWDSESNATQKFLFATTLVQSGGDTSPTVKLALEISVDGENWLEGVSINTTGDETKTSMIEVDFVPEYIRVKTTLGGGNVPNHKVQAALASTGGFKLLKVS